MQVLLTHNPAWEQEHHHLHLKLRAQWLAAAREKDMGKRKNLKQQCRETLKSMRGVRKRKYRTAEEVAERVFRIMTTRARLHGIETIYFPDPAQFNTLEKVRVFLQNQDQYMLWAVLNNRIVRKIEAENNMRPPRKISLGIMRLG